MPDIRLLRADETDAAAALHRRAGALIPGYDVEAEPLAQTLATYRAAFASGSLWGASDGATLVGCLALAPDWIEHLYVEPARHGEGIGRALIGIAQREGEELRLVTYQANARARRVYEAAGFVAEAFGVDETSPHRPANVRYRWRRSGAPRQA